MFVVVVVCIFPFRFRSGLFELALVSPVDNRKTYQSLEFFCLFVCFFFSLRLVSMSMECPCWYVSMKNGLLLAIN